MYRYIYKVKCHKAVQPVTGPRKSWLLLNGCNSVSVYLLNYCHPQIQWLQLTYQADVLLYMAEE